MVLVIGYGNPLRGDDGIGWRATQAIKAAEMAGVEVITSHQLTPELSEPIARSELAIFIDAVSNDFPGMVWCSRVDAGAGTCGPMAHHVTPEYLVGMAQALFGASPRAFTITVGGLSFDYEEKCTATVQAALQEVLCLVHELIAAERETPVIG